MTRTILLIILLNPAFVFAQFSSKEFQPVKLNKSLVQSQRIKSVMGMYQLNTSGERGEYMPYREDWGFYEKYKDDDFRKFLLHTSLSSFVSYDTSGNVTSVVNVPEKKYTKYAFNKQNKVVEHNEVELNYPTSSDTEMSIRYKFDEKGNSLGYEQGSQTVTLERNKKGEVTAWKVLEHEYISPKEQKKNTPVKSKDISSQYEFDKQGRITKQQVSPEHYTQIEYLENPATSTSTDYQNGQIKFKMVTVTDDKDRVIKSDYYKPRGEKLELYSSATYTYDEAGNLLSYRTVNGLEPALGQEMRFKLETSKNGLPLRRQTFKKDQLLGTEIFYYEHY